MKYAFFPGCSLESTARDFDRSVRALCRALGVELHDIPDWVCCGSTPAHTSNSTLAVALPAINLEKARAMQMPVLTACASCYARLRVANHALQEDPEQARRCQEATGIAYDGQVEVRHILDVLVNEVTVDRIHDAVSCWLNGLKVASYYGCLLSRPPDAVAFDSPEHPTCMDALVEAAGGVPVDWPLKTECCGASLSIFNTSVVNRLSHRLLSMAHRAGAECMVVACPLCQVNLDLRQPDAIKAHGELPPMPVLYISQLLGLALGLSPEALGLKALTVSAEPLLAKLNAMAPAGGLV